MFSTIDVLTLAFVGLAMLVLVAGMGLVLWQRHCTDRTLRKIKPPRRIDKRWRGSWRA